MGSHTSFLQCIEKYNCEVKLNEPMSSHITFKAGGNADVFVIPSDVESLCGVMKDAEKCGEKLYVIGNGSNLLVRDSGIEGVVVSIAGTLGDIKVDGNRIICGAGVPIYKMCMTAYENGLKGLEFAYGIPGTVGGAVFMNAGAYGGEMKDVLDCASHVTPDGKVGKLTKDELELGYRTSFYSKHDGYVVTSAEFVLEKGDKEKIKANMDELIARRKDKQPLEFPSAGSTFKRPEGHFAGGLIEQCGLKGYRIGGAEVSEKHAGFILNRYNGTADDVLALIDYVRNTVREKTGVTLEPEVKILP